MAIKIYISFLLLSISTTAFAQNVVELPLPEKPDEPQYAMQKVILSDGIVIEVINIMREWDNLPQEKRDNFFDEVKIGKDMLEMAEKDKKIERIRELFLQSPSKENAHNLREAVFEHRRKMMQNWSEGQKQIFKNNLPGNNNRNAHGYLKNNSSENEPLFKSSGNQDFKKNADDDDDELSNSDCFITDRALTNTTNEEHHPSIDVDGNGNIFVAYASLDGSGNYDKIRIDKSTDGGYTWSNIRIIDYAKTVNWPQVKIDGNNYVYVVYEYWYTGSDIDLYIEKSTDGGSTWNTYTIDGTSDGTWLPTFTIDGNNYLYVVYTHWDNSWGTYETGYAKSTDGGVTWPSKDYDGVNNNQFSADYYPHIDAGNSNYIYCTWDYNLDQIAVKNSSNGTAWSSLQVARNTDSDGTVHRSSVAASRTANTAVVVWHDYTAANGFDIWRCYSTSSTTITTFTNTAALAGSSTYGEGSPSICWSSDYWAGTTNYFYLTYWKGAKDISGSGYTKFAYATEALPGTWTTDKTVSDGANAEIHFFARAIAGRKGTTDANKYPAVVWADDRGSGPPNIYYSTYGKNYTIATSPTGLTVNVDGSPWVAPITFDWPAGVSHSLNAPSPQGGYVYSNWSDAGAQTHSITTVYGCGTTTTITANFTTVNKDGYWTSPTISLAEVAGSAVCGSWAEVGWTQTLAGGTVQMQLCDATGTPIPGWTSTQAGDGAKTWDISALNPTSYPSVKLRANLNGPASSARINNWYCRFNVIGTTTEYVWNGSVNTNWDNTGNWCCGGAASWPNATTKNVTIKSNFGTSNVPNVNNATASCGNLTIESWPSNINISQNLNVAGNIWIQSGATIDHLGGTITLAGDWRQDGGYNRNVSTTAIVLTGAGKQIYGTGTPHLSNLTLNGTASYTINGSGLRTWTVSGAGGNITFNAGSSLNANGKPMEVKGNWLNNGASGTFTSNANAVTFNGAIAQTITSNGQTFGSVIINNTASSTTDVTINDNLSLAATGILTLTDGLLNTGANRVIINNTSGAAVLIGSGNTLYTNSWINGNLRRFIANNTETYDFPVGISTMSALAQLKNNNLTGGGFSYIDAKLNSPFTNTGSLNTTNAQDFGTSYDDVSAEGEWQLDANAAPTSGSYDFYIYFLNNFAGLADNQFGLLKRPSGSTNASDWIGTSAGTLNANGGAGRMIADLYALRKGMTGFSKFGIGRAGAPLPVELMFLSGKCNLNNIKLQWATASETNSDYFTIERKKNNTEGWIVIGKIQGSGNSSSERNYEFTDEEITSGISYYRLKQTDFDGNSSSLKLIAVNCNDKTISSINIFIGENEQVFVMVNSDSEKYYNVSFYDASGRTVLKEIFDISKGDNLMLLNPKKLSTGIYFVTLQNDEEIITEKLFVR